MKKNKLVLTVLATSLVLPPILNKIAFIRGHNYHLFLQGSQRNYIWRGYNIRYCVAGEGEPLLLIHGIAMGIDSYSYRKNFTALTKHFKVYAIDLIGFGLSDCPDLDYDASTFVGLLISFIDEVIGEPIHIIASSLSSAYAILLTHMMPRMIKKLILISPNGILNPCGTHYQDLKNILLKSSYIGTSFYSLKTGKNALKYFLRKNVYYHKALVTNDMVNHYFYSAHFKGPCSLYAPAAFLSGKVNLSIRRELSELQLPILCVWGKESKFSQDNEWDEFTKINETVQNILYDHCGTMPNDECWHQFNQDALNFLTK